MYTLIVEYPEGDVETFECDTVTECREWLRDRRVLAKVWRIVGQDGSVIDEG